MNTKHGGGSGTAEMLVRRRTSPHFGTLQAFYCPGCFQAQDSIRSNIRVDQGTELRAWQAFLLLRPDTCHETLICIHALTPGYRLHGVVAEVGLNFWQLNIPPETGGCDSTCLFGESGRTGLYYQAGMLRPSSKPTTAVVQFRVTRLQITVDR